jgi:hypothetical protein
MCVCVSQALALQQKVIYKAACGIFQVQRSPTKQSGVNVSQVLAAAGLIYKAA